jgi:hypothetical protein
METSDDKQTSRWKHKGKGKTSVSIPVGCLLKTWIHVSLHCTVFFMWRLLWSWSEFCAFSLSTKDTWLPKYVLTSLRVNKILVFSPKSAGYHIVFEPTDMTVN